MSDPTWARVESYLDERLLPRDPVLDAVLEESRAAGLPEIHVTAAQGRFLAVLAGAVAARRILEVGTLGGYSTIWLARALPRGGRLVTIEADAAHAEVARRNLRRAGQAGRVDVRVGRSEEVLPKLREEGQRPFDLAFLDSEKTSYVEQFSLLRPLMRDNALVAVDNVIRGGLVADATSEDPRVRGVRRLVETLGADTSLEVAALQTVGSKGYDGMLLVRLLSGGA